MPIIIDGYNLLWSIHKTDEKAEAIEDLSLCRIVDRYLQMVKDKGEIIFDGTGPRDQSAFDKMSQLEVIFSGRSVDADTLIEDKVQTSTAPRRLKIVSNDRRIRRAASIRKATAVKCEAFWKEVHAQLHRKGRVKSEPSEKYEGLNEIEAEQWLEFFDV